MSNSHVFLFQKKLRRMKQKTVVSDRDRRKDVPRHIFFESEMSTKCR